MCIYVCVFFIFFPRPRLNRDSRTTPPQVGIIPVSWVYLLSRTVTNVRQKHHNGLLDASLRLSDKTRSTWSQTDGEKRGGWGANETTKGGVTNISHKYLLTSLNLSHLPTSHLSSKKLPLSERAETRPKATAHTHSKATLSICGHTTTTRREDIGSGWRTPHSRKAPTEALQHASQKLLVTAGCNDSAALVSYLVASKAPQTVCARCRFLSLVIAALSLSPSLSHTHSLSISLSLSPHRLSVRSGKRERASCSGPAFYPSLHFFSSRPLLGAEDTVIMAHCGL